MAKRKKKPDFRIKGQIASPTWHKDQPGGAGAWQVTVDADLTPAAGELVYDTEGDTPVPAGVVSKNGSPIKRIKMNFVTGNHYHGSDTVDDEPDAVAIEYRWVTPIGSTDATEV